MATGFLRAFQLGAALLVLTAATLCVMVITGLLSVDAALRILLNVFAVVAVCALALLALMGIFRVGGTRDS